MEKVKRTREGIIFLKDKKENKKRDWPAPSSRLWDGSGVFNGSVGPAVSHRRWLDSQHGHAGWGGPLAVGCEEWVVDDGIPGMTRSGGDGSGQGDGHEAESFPLQVLHGGTHVLLHQLCHLLLRHLQAIVWRRRLCSVTAPSNSTYLDTVTASLQIKYAQRYNITIMIIIDNNNNNNQFTGTEKRLCWKDF